MEASRGSGVGTGAVEEVAGVEDAESGVEVTAGPEIGESTGEDVSEAGVLDSEAGVLDSEAGVDVSEEVGVRPEVGPGREVIGAEDIGVVAAGGVSTVSMR